MIQSETKRTLGILMLDTRFPRIPGDVGNPQSYAFPIRMKTVPGATVERILAGTALGLRDSFIQAARALEAEQVAAITSSCGFLAIMQADLAAAVRIPVFLSSLLQVPSVHSIARGRIGILTANTATLTQVVLTSAGIGPAMPVAIAGMEKSQAFRDAILADNAGLDRDQVEKDVVAVAQTLIANFPDISAFVFECHNLPPYSRAVQLATGKPVYDIITMAQWVYSSLDRHAFPVAG